MKSNFLNPAILVVVLSSCFARADVIDSIVAKVNNQPILLSELEREIRFESLSNQQQLASSQLAYDRATLERLIDQEILHQQMSGYRLSAVTDADVQAQLADLKREVVGKEGDSGWPNCLKRVGLTEGDVIDRLTVQATILRFLDARLRPTIRIEREEMQKYYRETFLPRLQSEGGKQVPFNQVAAEIQQILVQQHMSSALSDWLKLLRSQTDIQIAPIGNVSSTTNPQ